MADDFERDVLVTHPESDAGGGTGGPRAFQLLDEAAISRTCGPIGVDIGARLAHREYAATDEPQARNKISRCCFVRPTFKVSLIGTKPPFGSPGSIRLAALSGGSYPPVKSSYSTGRAISTGATLTVAFGETQPQPAKGNIGTAADKVLSHTRPPLAPV